jgi:hypothetical protein
MLSADGDAYFKKKL